MKYFLRLALLVCVGYTMCLISTTKEQTTPVIETLIPQDLVTKLLNTYSDQEKVAIAHDLKNIKETCFALSSPAQMGERVYVATAGGPGACKSTILETYLQDKSNFVYADPDPRSLKFMVNTYYQSLTYYHISTHASYQDLLKNAYTKWRDASNYIANTIINEAYATGYNIAHGTTLTSPVVGTLLGKLKNNGYKIVLLLCYAPDQTRIKALDHRATAQAFIQVSSDDVVNKGKMFHERFPTYFQCADEICMYWTEDFLKGSVLAATYSKAAGLVVLNNDAFKAFSNKYDADRNGTLQSLNELTQKRSKL